MQLRRWLSLVGGVSLAAWMPAASAQLSHSVDDLYRRPTESGPSQVIGGRYTRSAAQPLEATRRDVALLSQQGFTFRDRSRTSAYTNMYTPAQLGLPEMPLDDRPAEFNLQNTIAKGEQDAALISGLHGIRDLENALPGRNPSQVPALNAYLYTPRAPTTRVQDMLGLVPSSPAPEGPPLATAAERLAALTAERVEQAREDGLRLFKQATTQVRDPRTGRYPDCPDCGDKLAQAIQQLRLVRDLDSAAYLPVLLMAHAYLEQERPTQATDTLLQAFAREPDLLKLEASQPFDRFFGDALTEGARSTYLTVQMRRYWRTGGDTEGAKVLEAYCAWRLGERVQALEAIGAIEKLTPRNSRRADALLSFAAGMRAVLQ